MALRSMSAPVLDARLPAEQRCADEAAVCGRGRNDHLYLVGELVRERVQAKEVEYVPDTSGRGAVRVEVPEERRAVACLDRAALDALVAVGRRVEDAFGAHQDVEWAIARGRGVPDGLFVLQSRRVTGLPQRPSVSDTTAMGLVMSMFGAGEAKD